MARRCSSSRWSMPSTPGARSYWKPHNFDEVRDEFLDVVVEHASEFPSDASEISLAPMRLQQVKAKYDPDNLFRVNQNIKPAG